MDSWSCRGNRGIPTETRHQSRGKEWEKERNMTWHFSPGRLLPTAQLPKWQKTIWARYARLDHTQQLSTHPSYDVNWSLGPRFSFVSRCSSLLFSQTIIHGLISRLFLNVRYYIWICVYYYWAEHHSPAAAPPPSQQILVKWNNKSR